MGQFCRAPKILLMGERFERFFLALASVPGELPVEIILDERHLRRILREYVDYYHSCRTHLSLEKDAPEPRAVHPPSRGKVTAVPKIGGLHHYYSRLAA